MENGKRICQALKELRKRIADFNGIPFEIEECTHKGDCPGTCPKCETEVQYLMDSINRREQEGKPVIIDGLMSDEELHKVFSANVSEFVNEKDENGLVTTGLPAPEEPDILMGDIMPLEIELAGMPRPPLSYDFALMIANELQNREAGNFIFSPTGLGIILNMLCEGMYKGSDVYRKTWGVIKDFNTDIEIREDDTFKLEHATSLWCNKALCATINTLFTKLLNKKYSAEVFDIDFAPKTKTKQCIDKWVSDNTHQMIQHLDTEISEDALLVLLDAIYMNGKWENPFDSELTETEIFHNSDGTESKVDMMYQEIEEAEYAETDEYQTIKLPYENSDYSMLVVLPKEKDGLKSIMGQGNWLEEEFAECHVELYMPRFKFYNTLSFKEILSCLGLKDLFDKDDSFPRITDFPAHISEIKQQCLIAVEEGGTEAAASTMAEVECGCLPPDDIPQSIIMKLDRPFGFAIKENYSNQILFMGVQKNFNRK